MLDKRAGVHEHTNKLGRIPHFWRRPWMGPSHFMSPCRSSFFPLSECPFRASTRTSERTRCRRKLRIALLKKKERQSEGRRRTRTSHSSNSHHRHHHHRRHSSIGGVSCKPIQPSPLLQSTHQRAERNHFVPDLSSSILVSVFRVIPRTPSQAPNCAEMNLEMPPPIDVSRSTTTWKNDHPRQRRHQYAPYAPYHQHNRHAHQQYVSYPIEQQRRYGSQTSSPPYRGAARMHRSSELNRRHEQEYSDEYQRHPMRAAASRTDDSASSPGASKTSLDFIMNGELPSPNFTSLPAQTQKSTESRPARALRKSTRRTARSRSQAATDRPAVVSGQLRRSTSSSSSSSTTSHHGLDSDATESDPPPPIKPARKTAKAAFSAKKNEKTKSAQSLTYEEKRRARECKVDGCGNYIINKGLCFRHGVSSSH